MLLNTLRRNCRIAALAAPLLLAFQPVRGLADEGGNAGFVYVMTNQASGNSILVFRRAADGAVSQVQQVSTLGLGSGGGHDPLGSQGALTLSEDGRLLFAVNAGSHDVSLLAVKEDGLQFLSKASSGGLRPVSVAVHRDVAYVVNAGGIPNVTALHISAAGQLATIGTRALPGGPNAGPGDVGVTPDGEVVVVTEKNTNKIDLFPADDDGSIGVGSTVPSSGATPFAVTFGRGHSLIVSEAANSTISSYAILNDDNGPTLQMITASLPDGGAAACWIISKRGGRLAFAVNSGSNTLSSIAVSAHGALQLEASDAGSTPSGTGPIDEALTRDGLFLYTIGTGNGTLTGFRVDGPALTPVASVAGLPASIQGVAAR